MGWYDFFKTHSVLISWIHMLQKVSASDAESFHCRKREFRWTQKKKTSLSGKFMSFCTHTYSLARKTAINNWTKVPRHTLEKIWNKSSLSPRKSPDKKQQLSSSSPVNNRTIKIVVQNKKISPVMCHHRTPQHWLFSPPVSESNVIAFPDILE